MEYQTGGTQESPHEQKSPDCSGLMALRSQGSRFLVQSKN